MATIRGCIALPKLFRFFPKTGTSFPATRYYSVASPRSDERIDMLKEFFKRKKLESPAKPINRSKFLEWNYRAEINAFSKRISEDFVGTSLEQAFTHRSHVIAEETRQKELGIDDPKGYLEDNQSLAEDGEALTRDFVARYLRTALPCLPEERIQNIRSNLLNEDNLAYIISNIGAEELILCAEFPPEKHTCVSTFYALVGAIEKSCGPERAALFIRDFLVASLSGQDIHALCMPDNAFDLLKEILIRDGKEEPEPRLLAQIGVNTIIPAFRIGLYTSKNFIASGDGESIGIAKENAALNALWRLWGIEDGKFEFPYSLDVSKVLLNNQSNILESEWTSKIATKKRSN